MTNEISESPNFKLSDLIQNIYSSTRYMCIVHRTTGHYIGEHVPRNSTFEEHRLEIMKRLREKIEGPAPIKRGRKKSENHK